MSALLVASDIRVEIDGRQIVDNVSLSATMGEFIGIVGPNGAGKSTLLRAIAGLLGQEAQGRIEINGVDLQTLSPAERGRRIAYLPQERPVYWSLPADEIVALGRYAHGDRHTQAGIDAIAQAMEATNTAHFRGRAAISLSGGERARIHLARALATQAPLLLADEPTTALDPAYQFDVMARLKAIAAAGGAVIAVLHDLALAHQFCTRIVVLANGRMIAHGAPSEALSAETLRSVFRVAPAPGDNRLVLAPTSP